MALCMGVVSTDRSESHWLVHFVSAIEKDAVGPIVAERFASILRDLFSILRDLLSTWRRRRKVTVPFGVPS